MSASPTTLSSLPTDLLLQICTFLPSATLSTLCESSAPWRHFIQTHVWPRRLATLLGVRAVRFTWHAPLPPTLRLLCGPSRVPVAEWLRLLRTVEQVACSRVLYVCVLLCEQHTSITSLALKYAVSVHDILRANALFKEYQLASRTHVYVPLKAHGVLRSLTGGGRHEQTPVLVRDVTLSNKLFLVVRFCGQAGDGVEHGVSEGVERTYVRGLLVRLMARGLLVVEDEVRYYLQENDYDVAKAYKQLLLDHQFAP